MNNIITTALQTLGLRGVDKVTGFEGMVATVGFDAYGCVQLALTPTLDKEGKPRDGHWFDIKRVTLGERVMDIPAFASIMQGQEAGAAEKPKCTI